MSNPVTREMWFSLASVADCLKAVGSGTLHLDSKVASDTEMRVEHSADGKTWTTYSDSRFPFLAQMHDRERLAFWKRRERLLARFIALDVIHGRDSVARVAEVCRVSDEIEALMKVLHDR